MGIAFSHYVILDTANVTNHVIQKACSYLYTDKQLTHGSVQLNTSDIIHCTIHSGNYDGLCTMVTRMKENV